MEIDAIIQFVNPELTTETPIEPGLYLYFRNEQKDKEYPIIDLVEVRYYKNKYLIADSDNWETYLPVKSITNYFPGNWSKKIVFKK